jgi:hypothetical protein
MRCANQATVHSPSRNTPSAGLNSMRWQVSRLAEQGFPFDARLPDPFRSVASGISPVTVAGAAAVRVRSSRI